MSSDSAMTVPFQLAVVMLPMVHRSTRSCHPRRRARPARRAGRCPCARLAAPPRQARAPAGSGPDVLVEAEQVAGVVAALDLAQPLEVGAVVLGDLALVVAGGEVDVA